MRKVDSCMNCGEQRELAAHGLCFKCYRNTERARQRATEAELTDRHNPGIRKQHKQLFRGLASIMSGLSDVQASKSDVLAVRSIISPYLEPIAQYLEQTRFSVNSEHTSSGAFTPFTEDTTTKNAVGQVNGEQVSRDAFTVHSDEDEQEPDASI
jgi:hypothetical protein